MTLTELQLLVLAIFAFATGVAVKKPDPKGWAGWVSLISGITLAILCLLLLFKPAV